MTITLRDLEGATHLDATGDIVKMAILAVGGQGGGVLNGWIIDLAQRSGHDVQATSIAGVAQRTGSTVYYVEMLPKSDRQPVFSLAPGEGDVDIVIAAELMEAGRAITRGLVSPGRTRMIVSTHRQLATLEKVVPGDGTGDGEQVLKAIDTMAAQKILFDMQSIAEEEGTVISAALFGAIAGSGVLPFDVESYRDTIRASGRGVERSLAAFDRAHAIAAGDAEPEAAAAAPSKGQPAVRGPEDLIREYEALSQRALRLPEAAVEVAQAGLRKLVDFQGLGYASEYLDRLEDLARQDDTAGGASREFAFTGTAAKYLANAMAYDDIIRVAHAKTRAGRFARIQGEVGASERHLTRVTEYTHPGAAEVVSLFPARLGRRVADRPGAMRLIDRLVNRGRHIRTDRIGGFLSLYLAAGLRRWRPTLLRHEQEMAHLENWLAAAQGRLPMDYDFAVQTLRIRRLVKGYSDTHARGLSRFDRVMAGTRLVEGRSDAADWTRRLIDAALADHENTALDGALQTIRSFAEPEGTTG